MGVGWVGALCTGRSCAWSSSGGESPWNITLGHYVQGGRAHGVSRTGLSGGGWGGIVWDKGLHVFNSMKLERSTMVWIFMLFLPTSEFIWFLIFDILISDFWRFIFLSMQNFAPACLCDGLLEVVGLTGVMHLVGAIPLLLAHWPWHHAHPLPSPSSVFL